MIAELAKLSGRGRGGVGRTNFRDTHAIGNVDDASRPQLGGPVPVCGELIDRVDGDWSAARGVRSSSPQGWAGPGNRVQHPVRPPFVARRPPGVVRCDTLSCFHVRSLEQCSRPVSPGPSPAAARAVDRDGPATVIARDEVPGPIAKTMVPATDHGWRATAMMMMTTMMIGTNRGDSAAVLKDSVPVRVNVGMTADVASNRHSVAGCPDSVRGMSAEGATRVIAGPDRGSAADRAALRIMVQVVMDAGLTVRPAADRLRLRRVEDGDLTAEVNAVSSRRSVVAHLPLQHVVDVAPIAVASTGSSRHSGVDRPSSDPAAVLITGRVSGVMVAASRDLASVAGMMVRASAAAHSRAVAVHRHSDGDRHEEIAALRPTVTVQVASMACSAAEGHVPRAADMTGIRRWGLLAVAARDIGPTNPMRRIRESPTRLRKRPRHRRLLIPALTRKVSRRQLWSRTLSPQLRQRMLTRSPATKC